MGVSNVGGGEMSEHHEQAAFFQLLAREQGHTPELKFVHAIPNGGKRDIVTATNMKREGVRRGVFDIFAPIPRFGCPGFYLEMKFGGNDLTEEQKEFRKFVVSQGYRASVFWSAVDAFTALMTYLGKTDRLKAYDFQEQRRA